MQYRKCMHFCLHGTYVVRIGSYSNMPCSIENACTPFSVSVSVSDFCFWLSLTSARWRFWRFRRRMQSEVHALSILHGMALCAFYYFHRLFKIPCLLAFLRTNWGVSVHPSVRHGPSLYSCRTLQVRRRPVINISLGSCQIHQDASKPIENSVRSHRAASRSLIVE